MTEGAAQEGVSTREVRTGLLVGLVAGVVVGLVVTIALAGRAEPGDGSSELVAKTLVWLGAAGLVTLFAHGVWRYSGVGWAAGMTLSLLLAYVVGAFFGGIGS